ncbi:MAG: hypothetical protein LBJ18_02865 [Rickettsiales bacterium]|jgi:hypothetical protein|nr:hypothetical protein [Rickettsiales bacterium]
MNINQFKDIVIKNPKGSAYILTIISRLDFMFKNCWNSCQFASSVKSNMEEDGKNIDDMDVFGTSDFINAIEMYNKANNDKFAQYLSGQLFIYTNNKFSVLKAMIFNISSLRHWLEHIGNPRNTSNICKEPKDMFRDLFLMLPSRFSNEIIMRFCSKLDGPHRTNIFNELQTIKNGAAGTNREFIESLNKNLSCDKIAEFTKVQKESNCVANYDLLAFMKRYVFMGGSDGVVLLRSCVQGAVQFIEQGDKFPKDWYRGGDTDIGKIRRNLKKNFQKNGNLPIPFDECEMIFDFVLGVHSVFREYYSRCAEKAGNNTQLRNYLAHSHLFFDDTKPYLQSLQEYMKQALEFFDNNRQYCTSGTKRNFTKSMIGLCKHNDWCNLIAETSITKDDGGTVQNKQRYNVPISSIEKSQYSEYGEKFGFDNRQKIKRAHISECIKIKIKAVKSNPNHINTRFSKMHSARYLYFFRKYAYKVMNNVIEADIGKLDNKK